MPSLPRQDKRLLGRYLKALAKAHGAPPPNRFIPSAQAGFSVMERAREWDRRRRR
jgi:hypothetical protein